MANLTSTNSDYSRITRQHYPKDGIRESEEDEDESYSLPSFTDSVRQQLEALDQQVNHRQHPLQKCGSLTSLKEIESQNKVLRRENFDLKLRLYMIDKKATGISRPDYDSSLAQEMSRKDDMIRSLQASLEEKEDQLRREKNYRESVIKVKDMELNKANKERDQLREQFAQLNHQKENMGQALSRQLQKIEQLLEETTKHVQEMN